MKKIQELKKEKAAHYKEKQEKYEQHKELRGEVEEKNKELQDLDQKIKDQKARLDALYAEKRELKEKYFKELLEFWTEDREINHLEYIAKKK